MSQQRILVITGLINGSGSGTQETYNATQSNNQWCFGTTGGICENSNMFTLVPHGSSGTAIKAGDNERYLSVTINGAGVPDSNPTFTSINTSGGSVVNITGSPATITKFDQVDESGITAFGFTVKVQRRGGEWDSYKYYFVPGSFKIEVMGTTRSQLVFEIR